MQSYGRVGRGGGEGGRGSKRDRTVLYGDGGGGHEDLCLRWNRIELNPRTHMSTAQET